MSAPCPHATSCPLYPVFRSQRLLAIWKMQYCEGEFTKCERHKLSCEAKSVPATMLPNGKLLVLP